MTARGRRGFCGGVLALRLELGTWRIAYRTALDAYRAGKSRTVFPAGTWQLYEDCHVFRYAA